MERAKHNEYCASILAVLLLLAPQLSFARGMSGGAAGRAGGSSLSSAGFGSARMAFNGRMLSSQPRVLAPNPRSDAFIAAHNSLDPRRSIQPFITVAARTSGGRLSFLSRLTGTMWIFAITLRSS